MVAGGQLKVANAPMIKRKQYRILAEGLPFAGVGEDANAVPKELEAAWCGARFAGAEVSRRGTALGSTEQG